MGPTGPNNSKGMRPEEATILDWFASLLRGDPIPLPTSEELRESEVEPSALKASAEAASPQKPQVEAFPDLPALVAGSLPKLRIPAGLILALTTQLLLERRAGSPAAYAFLFLLAALSMGWGILAGDVQLPEPPVSIRGKMSTGIRWRPFGMAIVLGLLTFLTAGGNQFRRITIVCWFGSLLFMIIAFLPDRLHPGVWWQRLRTGAWWQRLRAWLASPTIGLALGAWDLVILVALLLVTWFRFAHLSSIPFEMWSDHAEKLLDVRDVLQGDHHIFFPRNSGREAIEFYGAALVSSTFGTGLSFLTLKLVTASAGLLSLPFLYLFAKEVGGRRVGLFALVLGGIAFWPNIASRVGLRMPLNELFVAIALFFLLRGIRRGERNDFLWSGLAVGLGLHGYSAFRILPLVVLLALALYWLHAPGRDRRLQTASALIALILVSVVGALPLLRVTFDMPDNVLYRTLTRMGTLERSYQANPLVQFLINMRDILTMFSWNSGQMWPVTVPGRPILDWMAGALFHLGIVAIGLAYLRRRQWQHLFVLLSLPILLLPSSLSLAFPNENPAPNRVTGAIVPVFTIAAFALETVYQWARDNLGSGRRVISIGLAGGVLAISAVLNYQLVFDEYAELERVRAWNNSEAGEVMGGFAHSVGSFDTTYFVAYPYWIDSRLVAIEAGAPLRDYSILPENLADQELDSRKYHLFFVKPEDGEAMHTLRELYPSGSLSYHASQVPGRDFLLYLVPPVNAPLPESVEEALD